MPTFRKKPVVVEAVGAWEALRCASHAWQEMPAWLRDHYEKGNVIFAGNHVLILTLEGNMRAEHADWIIRGVNGEIYPCKPDIFEKTYEEVLPGEEGKVPDESSSGSCVGP